MNWMYDHLRHLPRHHVVVLADEVTNRAEFPALDVRPWNQPSLPRRIWRRVNGSRLYPPDRVRLRRLDADLLHSHFGYMGIEDRILHAARPTPWIVSFYGADVFEWPREDRWREAYASVFDAATLVLGLGPFMVDALHSLGCSPSKTRVHPLGVDLSDLPFRPRTRQPDEPLRILFAGTFREKKGVPYLLHAVSIIHHEGHSVELLLVGDSTDKPGDLEEKQRIVRLIDELGLQSVVRISPFLTFRALVDTAAHCHVLAAPSITAENGDAEGTPFIIQQMMGTGMPVVSTRHSDIPFIFGPLADRLAAERDVEGLARALRPYAVDHLLAAREADLFRQHVVQHLDVRQHAARLAGLYDDVIA
jgi:colanic acid/amylovoran biosynthesis glycosyltransferase